MPADTEDICRVEFQPQGKRVRIARGSSVMEAAEKAGVFLASDCGGNGRCGRCRVKILSGAVAPPDRAELETIERKQYADRLACQAILEGDAKVHVPAASLRTRQVLVVDGQDRPPQNIDPIGCVEVRLDPPSLNDQRSDLQRLFDALEPPDQAALEVHPRFVGRLSELIRSESGRLTVFLKNGVPIGVGEPGTVPYGLALDVGTTSIAGRLTDLSTGEQKSSAGAMNPQISIGEDVISRLDHALKSREGRDELAFMLRQAINTLATELCDQAGVSPWLVTDVVICGNTAMSHLLLKLPVAYLARAPFLAGFSSPLLLAATDLDLPALPGARVTIMPCIQGFIGGDHVAMVLACDIDQSQDTVIGIDIGTNTEIVLARPGAGLFVASCASGPALEGAHIRDGMRASPGAIAQVRIDDQGPQIETIDHQTPVGICGSGIIDAIAELLRVGLIDARGHLQNSGPNVGALGKGLAYRLVPAPETGSGDDILVTQGDISEIQLAKAAIQAGVLTILQKTDTPLEQVAAVYLAGAFGSHINIDSALSIGLFPRLPRARFVQAGNAASVGAQLVLLSEGERERAYRIAREARPVELAGDAGFSNLLARALRFDV